MDIEQHLAQAVERMPAFPRSVQRLLELTRQIDTPPRAIVAVLETDPVLAARLLRTINSAYYGLSRQVGSIDHAVMMLGINTVKNMALTVASVGVLPTHNAAGFDTGALLDHSLTVAVLARRLAERLGLADPGEAYVAGLLHDFGKVVLAVHLPGEFAEALQQAARQGVSLHCAEQQVLGIDHSHAGALLAEQWQFPASLSAAIGAHHQGEWSIDSLRCLLVADQLARFDEHDQLRPGSVLTPLPAPVSQALITALHAPATPPDDNPYPALLAALPERHALISQARAFLA